MYRCRLFYPPFGSARLSNYANLDCDTLPTPAATVQSCTMNVLPDECEGDRQPSEAATFIWQQSEIAGLELFENCALAASIDQAAPFPETNAETIVAVIGFAADCARGALVLVAPKSCVIRCREALAGPDAAACACDVLGEVANMMLGHLKGRLSAAGLNILMSTPTTAQGAPVEIAPCENSKWIIFSVSQGQLALRVDVEIQQDFRWVQGAAATNVAAAGDLMLF